MSHFTYPSNYSAMKPKADRFRRGSSFVVPSSEWKYNLKDNLTGYFWIRVEERFAESIQFALLRAMAVVGVIYINCDDVFNAVYYGLRPFSGLSKALLEGTVNPDWYYFAQQLALENHDFYVPHFPPYCPEWLLPYGYTQQQYLSDLAVYWDEIDDGYYIPWPITRFGQDSPAIARLRRIGDVARREIDEVGRHARKHLT